MMNEDHEDDFLFSKDLRDTMKPFDRMSVDECLGSLDFWHTIAMYGGMSEEKFQEILNQDEDEEE